VFSKGFQETKIELQRDEPMTQTEGEEGGGRGGGVKNRSGVSPRPNSTTKDWAEAKKMAGTALQRNGE